MLRPLAVLGKSTETPQPVTSGSRVIPETSIAINLAVLGKSTETTTTSNQWFPGDPGGWEWISPSVLIIPLDIHMFRAAGVLGFTGRKTASCAAAFEITESFLAINPDNPVKYNFALTRMACTRTLCSRSYSQGKPRALELSPDDAYLEVQLERFSTSTE